MFNNQYQIELNISHPVNEGISGSIQILHPGYEGGSTHLLTLLGNDGPGGDLCYDLVHTACAIITGNRFDGFLTRETPHSIEIVESTIFLKAGTYHFHVPQNKERNQTIPKQGISPSIETPWKYPIVPNFQEWVFSQNFKTIPQTQIWRDGVQQSRNTVRSSNCQVTGSNIHNEKGHILPSSEIEWFYVNSMSEHFPQMGSGNERYDHKNLLTLRPDVHHEWEQNRFTFFPKRTNNSPLTLSTQCFHDITGILSQLHNCPLKYHHRLSPEALFARFAWSIFPFLKTFLHHPKDRVLLVKDESGLPVTQTISAADARALVRSRSGSPRKKRGAVQEESSRSPTLKRKLNTSEFITTSEDTETSLYKESSEDDQILPENINRGRKRVRRNR